MGLSTTFKSATSATESRTDLVSVLAFPLMLGRWIAKAILLSGKRRADREIEKYLERSGGRLTDDIERRMIESLSHKNLRF